MAQWGLDTSIDPFEASDGFIRDIDIFTEHSKDLEGSARHYHSLWALWSFERLMEKCFHSYQALCNLVGLVEGLWFLIRFVIFLKTPGRSKYHTEFAFCIYILFLPTSEYCDYGSWYNKSYDRHYFYDVNGCFCWKVNFLLFFLLDTCLNDQAQDWFQG